MSTIITTDQLSAALRRRVVGDLMAELACEAANDAVEKELGYSLDAVVDDVVVLDGDGSDVLLLPALPVWNVSLVEILPYRSDGEPIEVPSDFYWLDQKMGALKTRPRATRWLPGNGIYQVTYSHGYGTPSGSGSGAYTTYPPIPGGITRVALTAAQRYFDQGIVRQEVVGAVTTVYGANDPTVDLTAGERSALAKYGLGR